MVVLAKPIIQNVNKFMKKQITIQPLKEILAQRTNNGSLYRQLKNGAIHCYACGHNCTIKPDRFGVCRVRFNRDGQLKVPWGYVGGIQIDPIEKKPFFHAFPKNNTLSFGMLGCDFHCAYCQNWITSQTLRDPKAVATPQAITAADLVEIALTHKTHVITSTYNEPLITSEWAVEIFKMALSNGLVTAYVSNGNGTPEVINYLRPWVDLYKVDLKSFQDKNYRKLGGVLQHTLDTIKLLWEHHFWLEVVSLIVPGFNDSPAELTEMAQFLVGISPDIPWHDTAFHQEYKMIEPNNTSASQLLTVVEIGRSAGLRYVYAGNRPGQVGNNENTYCYKCQSLLIERNGFLIGQNRLQIDGDLATCPECQTEIAGIWSDRHLQVRRQLKSQLLNTSCTDFLNNSM